MVCERDLIILVINVLVLLYSIHYNWRRGGIVLMTKDIRKKSQVLVPNYKAAEKQWLIIAQLESLSVNEKIGHRI